MKLHTDPKCQGAAVRVSEVAPMTGIDIVDEELDEITE